MYFFYDHRHAFYKVAFRYRSKFNSKGLPAFFLLCVNIVFVSKTKLFFLFGGNSRFFTLWVKHFMETQWNFL